MSELNTKSILEKIDWAVTDTLTETVKAKLLTKVQDISGQGYEVRYIGIRAPQSETELAGKRLAGILNEICGAFQIVGQLGDAMKFNLDDRDEAFYMAYIAFTPEAARVIDRADLKEFISDVTSGELLNPDGEKK